ncbi:hypothetical protein RND81_14G092800, partial [Saponaria officinalis]
MTVPTMDPNEKEAINTLLKIGPIPSPSSRKPSDEGKRNVWDEKGRNKLAQIFISYGKDYIYSIAFQYIEDDKLVISPIYGSPNFDGLNFIALRFADAKNNEFITNLRGSYGTKDQKKGQGITSLTIETNLTIYGPFGNTGPNYPKFEIDFGPENEFAGFHGTSSQDIVTSIGVYLRPIDNVATFNKKF